jgi:hypothetical protein
MVPIENSLGSVANIKSSFSSNIPEWKSQQTSTFGQLVGAPSFLVTCMVLIVLVPCIVIILLPQLQDILASLSQGRPNNIKISRI